MTHFCKLRQSLLALTCFGLLLLSIRPRLFRYTATFWGVFDSMITLTACVETRGEFDQYLDLATDSFTEYHDVYDRFSKTDAIVSVATVNRRAGQMQVTVGEPLFSLLLYAQEGQIRSLHTVVPTFGAVTELWRRAIRSGNERIPSDPVLRTAYGHTASAGLLLKKEENIVFLTDPDMLLDLGAIAKGYATERVGSKLARAGLSRFALSSGGNIRCYFPPDGKSGWEIGVQSPDEAILSGSPAVVTLLLCNRAVSTSGDYQRFFWYEKDGEFHRAHHLIDPVTLYPAEHYRSVTVVSDSAADADLFSTALFLLEEEAGAALADREGLGSLWIFPNQKVRINAAMQALEK